MATLAGQRAQFTWALNQYNLTEDPELRTRFARRMAEILNAAPKYGFTREQVSQGKSYPAEVEHHMSDPHLGSEEGISEQSAESFIKNAVDTSDVVRLGEGSGAVYAYGYACAPDRLKIGSTETDVVERIAAQVSTSTPDRPSLKLEIRTDHCRLLERAIHAVLEVRGKRVDGGGAEWFRTSRDEIIEIFEFINGAESRPT